MFIQYGSKNYMQLETWEVLIPVRENAYLQKKLCPEQGLGKKPTLKTLDRQNGMALANRKQLKRVPNDKL